MILKSVLVGVMVAATMPFALILSQWPAPDLRANDGGLDFSRLPVAADPAPLETWRADAGTVLGLRRYLSGASDVPLIVLVHGSGWHGLLFDALAQRLAAANHADVLVPDLRGHGPSPKRRGDVDYIGQLEDDLAALIKSEARPGQKVVLLGHSSGGGLVARMAGGTHGGLLDGAVFLAPYLGHAAATTRTNSGGWARPMVRRIIGLSMLNRLGITALNGLSVIQFRFPQAVLEGRLGHTATRAYSYRMNVSYAPRIDLAADVAGLPPFLLLAGEVDEAMTANAYQPTLSAMNPEGHYVLLASVGHLDVVDAEQTYSALVDWLERFSR